MRFESHGESTCSLGIHSGGKRTSSTDSNEETLGGAGTAIRGVHCDMTQGILGTRYLAAVGIPFHPTTNRLSPASLIGNRRPCQAHSTSVRFLVPNGEVCSFMSVGRVVYFLVFLFRL